MSSSPNDKRNIDPGCATIIGAGIGAIALIVGTVLGAILGARSQPVQVFLGASTPTIVDPQPNIIGLLAPQPTYTLLPTYTPYPTFVPNRVVATQGPIIVTPTSSADQQNPPSGSIILAGQGYTKNDVVVTLLKPFSIGSTQFRFNLLIQNNSAEQIVVRWRNSFIHAKDDKGKIYRQTQQDKPDWDKLKQFSIPSGEKRQINGASSDYAYAEYVNVDEFDLFLATFDPSVKYIIVTVDQMGGMENLNWRYDFR